MKLLLSRPAWLVVGLGNVGEQYRETRHNFGFMAGDRYARKFGYSGWKKRAYFSSLYIKEGSIFLAKPRTMMNLSGIAVKKLLKKTGLDSSRLIVLYDDIDIPVGRIRVRKKGGHGGHKGMKSIIASIGADNFPRVRLGIGGEHSDIVDYVLSGFSEEEGEKIEQALGDSVDIIEMIVSGKIEEAMNKYN